MSETHGEYHFSPQDQELIGEAIEYADTAVVVEVRRQRQEQMQALLSNNVQMLLKEVRKLRQQVAEQNKRQEAEAARVADELDRMQQELSGLRQWVVRLVREKEAIETVCCLCGEHMSGPMGAAPENTSHGICNKCLEEKSPEKATA